VKIRESQITLAVLQVLGVGFATMLANGPAVAQQAQKVEKIEVTGSNIKRTEVETASPVQIITREDIERTGKQSIQEVLRGITGDNQGSIPTAFTGGFAAGSSAISLRGLGVNSTLVLVNGRRMATYGLADDGSRSFVDLNTIPLEAVDRVEILKDGASAIYGSDAVGGVVNIILRKNYTGAAAGGSIGANYKGDGTATRAFGSLGFGNPDTDRYNVFVTIEGSKEKAIKQEGYPTYLGTSDLRQFGFFDNRQGSYAAGLGSFADGSGPAWSSTTPYGTVRRPGGTQSNRINLTPCPEVNPLTGVCTFSLMPYHEIQPDIERLNVFGRGTLQLGSTLQAYLEAGYFRSKTKATGTPGGVNDGGVFNPADPANPLITHTTTLPANHPDNPTGINRTISLMTPLGGRNGQQENELTRFVAGISGSAMNWDFDVGAAYIRSELTDTNTGYVRYSVLQNALNNGTYRINNPTATGEALLAAISPTLVREPTSSVSLVDFKATRELFNLAGGPLGLAIGAEYRKEKADTPPLPYTDVSDIVGLGYSAFKADRSVTAAYMEVNAPVFKQLELSAAVRTDRYSDYGRSTTPKFGFKFTPTRQFLLRGTYAEAFRAPGPTESGNSSSLGFTNIALVSIGDPSVKPEKSKSYTLGLLFEPTNTTSAGIDFYRVKRTDEIVQVDQAAVLGGAPTTGVPGSRIPGAQPNSFIYYDPVNGDLAAVSGPYANAASTHTSGYDIDLRHRMNLKDAGRVIAQFNWTHVTSFQRTLQDGTTFEYAGTQGPYALSSAAGTPKDKGVFSLTYDSGPWAITASANYVGPLEAVDHKGESMVDNGDGTWATTTFEGAYYTDGNTTCGVFYPNADTHSPSTGGAAPGGCKIKSFTTFDLFGRWTMMKNLDLNLSIQNVFNRLAPFNPYTYGGTNYNPALHQSGAVGRFFTLGFRYTFK
jgi:iron complex outermembrane recepter protein